LGLFNVADALAVFIVQSTSTVRSKVHPRNIVARRGSRAEEPISKPV
jgi:hypothetical protein